MTILIHSGSRGLGYQVCHDYLETMLNAANKYFIKLPDARVVDVVHAAGIGRKVAQQRPIGVVKG